MFQELLLILCADFSGKAALFSLNGLVKSCFNQRYGAINVS